MYHHIVRKVLTFISQSVFVLLSFLGVFVPTYTLLKIQMICFYSKEEVYESL